MRGAVNRLYYGCFYAVLALLLTEGYSSSKHTGVQALFDFHWVKSGRLPAEMGRFLHRLFDYRQMGDYGKKTAFTREDVEAWSHQADSFIAEIHRRTAMHIEEP